MIKFLKYGLFSLVLINSMTPKNPVKSLRLEIIYPKGLPEKMSKCDVYSDDSSLFLVSNSVGSVDKIGRVYQSLDYGNTWSLLFQKEGNITGLCSSKSMIMCASVTKDKKFRVESSNNDGKTWKLVYSGRGLINMIACVQDKHWLIGGRVDEQEMFLKSTDQGVNWKEVSGFKNHVIYNKEIISYENAIYGVMHSTFDMRTLDLFRYDILTDEFTYTKIKERATLVSFNKSPFGVAVCGQSENGKYFVSFLEHGKLRPSEELLYESGSVNQFYGGVSGYFVIIENTDKNQHFNSYIVYYGKEHNREKLQKESSKLLLGFSFDNTVCILADRVIYRISR